MNQISILTKVKTIFTFSLLMVCVTAQAAANESIQIQSLSKQLEVGDIVFIQVSPYPFQKIASTTKSWVNHVRS